MKMIGILYDNFSGHIGDQAIGVTVNGMLKEMGVEFEEPVNDRFNAIHYQTIIVSGGSLLAPSPDYIHDKFRVPGPRILNCCGVWASPTDLNYPNDYRYISVGSNGDKQKLRYLTEEIKVVPCTTMLPNDLSDFDLKVQKPSLGIRQEAVPADDTTERGPDCYHG